MKMGILCPSEIAFRRFMPALMKCKGKFEYVGVAFARASEWHGDINDNELFRLERSKAINFQKEYGGAVFEGYTSMLENDVDCVYIPLPPALHFVWAKQALEYGKHILLEKPFTTALADTKVLLDIAKSKSLAVHENYMFSFHNQMESVLKELENNTIGKLRLIRAEFGFPFRGKQDFRYNMEMGGGALLDCGGYVIKLASILLGESARIVQRYLHQDDGFDIDLYGSGVMANNEGLIAQIAFGMDNEYRCDLNIWGSRGSICTGRIFTAPDGFSPSLQIKKGSVIEERQLQSDDSFKKSLEFFYDCILQSEKREIGYMNILKQAELVEAFRYGNLAVEQGI